MSCAFRKMVTEIFFVAKQIDVRDKMDLGFFCGKPNILDPMNPFILSCSTGRSNFNLSF